MPWTIDNPPDAIKNKSKAAIQAGVDAANSCFTRGQDEEYCIFAAIAAANNYERTHSVKKQRVQKEPPLHVKVLLEALEQRKKVPEGLKTPLEGSESSSEYQGIADLVKAVKTRSIVSADFDKQDRLVIKFDDGTSIVTRSIDIKSYIEQYVSISTPSIFDFIQFNTQLTNPIEYLEGRIFYDNTSKSLSYYNDAHDVTVNLGQESLTRVFNSTGSTVTNGQVVYISGAASDVPSISLAQANSEMSSTAVLGIATHDIHADGFGYITVLGVVNGVNTSEFNSGDILYLSATTPGGLTNVSPLQPNYDVVVGYCITSHVTEGKVFVRVDKRDWFPSLEIVSQVPSYNLPLVPTIYKPELVNKNDGFEYNQSTGEITINTTGTFAISITFNAVATSSNKKIYFYSEEDLGYGWQINKYSGKVLELINGTQTQLLLTSNRYFIKGNKLRLNVWGDSGVTLQTVNLPGTVAGTVLLPAYRFLMA